MALVVVFDVQQRRLNSEVLQLALLRRGSAMPRPGEGHGGSAGLWSNKPSGSQLSWWPCARIRAVGADTRGHPQGVRLLLVAALPSKLIK